MKLQASLELTNLTNQPDKKNCEAQRVRFVMVANTPGTQRTWHLVNCLLIFFSLTLYFFNLRQLKWLWSESPDRESLFVGNSQVEEEDTCLCFFWCLLSGEFLVSHRMVWTGLLPMGFIHSFSSILLWNWRERMLIKLFKGMYKGLLILESPRMNIS